MRILINSELRGEQIGQFTKLIEKAFQTAARLENLGDEPEVSVSFVDDRAIRALNKQYRGLNEPTDVLSFPQDELPPGLPQILGDIVISLERAEEQAGEYGHRPEREVVYLAVHGLLHLLGYDHETEEGQNIMRAKEEQVLAALDLGR
ncbi:MAG TPA: rRNA maturation RNase YbeY [Firmicutes bacterium]|nr:rRNA maturation RNase YbeY [Bacillota bacterium]